MARTWKKGQRREMVERWAGREGVSAGDVERLLRLCRRAFRAGEYWCNVDDRQAGRMLDHAKKQVEVMAASLGWETDWPGLWPVFRKEGVSVFLPDL